MTTTVRMLSMAGVLALGACNGGDKDPDDTGPSGGGVTLLVLDVNNYSYTANLSLTSVALEALADNTIDWSALTVDFRGRPVVPTDVDWVTLASIWLSQEELIEKIDTNTLLMSDVGDYREVYPVDATSVQFSDLSVLGDAFPYDAEFVVDDELTWLLSVWKKNERGQQEILTSLFVVPSDTGGATSVNVANDSANITFEANLSDTPVVAPADAEAYGLNWTAVNTDVNGAEFDELLADTLRIAHLSESSEDDVQAVFLSLDIAADETYFLDIFADRSVDDLAAATAIDGTPFPGFTADGTWILSFECTDSSCFSPAPLFLTVVEVE